MSLTLTSTLIPQPPPTDATLTTLWKLRGEIRQMFCLVGWTCCYLWNASAHVLQHTILLSVSNRCSARSIKQFYFTFGDTCIIDRMYISVNTYNIYFARQHPWDHQGMPRFASVFKGLRFRWIDALEMRAVTNTCSFNYVILRSLHNYSGLWFPVALGEYSCNLDLNSFP